MNPDNKGNFAFIKPGRAPSLGRGLLGVSAPFLFFAFALISDVKLDGLFIFILIVVSTISFIRGTYYLYNAFSSNRFSDQEIVSPEKENDPMDKIISKNQYGDSSKYNQGTYERKYCPKCASKLPDVSKYCNKCGHEI